MTWAPALLPRMPPLSCVGITSLQARAEQLVLALSAAMLYHSVGICCCMFTQVLTLQPKPRLHKCISFFIQQLCRGSCKALPVESVSCFAGMEKPDDFSMCPAKIMPNNLVCILISQPCWEKLIHQCSDGVCLQTCLSEASASSSWAHPNCYCLPGAMGSKGHQRLSHRLEGTGACLASLCAWIRAAAASSLVRFSSAGKCSTPSGCFSLLAEPSHCCSSRRRFVCPQMVPLSLGGEACVPLDIAVIFFL